MQIKLIEGDIMPLLYPCFLLLLLQSVAVSVSVLPWLGHLMSKVSESLQPFIVEEENLQFRLGCVLVNVLHTNPIRR